ncbi:Os09g0413600 [Oryza sativa Japonica Group]|uniref:Os09g0413600 protein n=2 Tax=Oryza sativa subsp. japonica TaxID=39947 RepID=Q6ES33_ORYSJ|nr:hypothetical protein EE612_047817 [Oryza sativa]BAD28537.1 unknown protein [Oryza sativa Japonica Group]BAT08065.1 Os09g0413600 [Oryza sativa Japonica Group]
MDAGEGGGAPAAAAAVSNGFVHAVVRWCFSPLFFWLFTVALVAAIHLASTYISPSRDEEDKEKKARRGGDFAGAGEEREEEEVGRNDDKILEMMRSFSFMHASEEDFMEGMATYDHVVARMAPEPLPLTPPAAPPPSTFSFRFQHQLPEILRETAVVSGEIPVQVLEEHEPEKKPAIAMESKQERERDAEEREVVMEEEEEEEQSREAVSGRTSFASEFSGFGGDSDSESTASDGYSVKDLVVDSDSDWFLSEKDFPAAAVAGHDAGSLRGYYKAKVLKALEALDASASNLERSFQDSATTVSPGSVVGQASPDIIGAADDPAKYPEDMWSRSPSPDVEYNEDEHKGNEATNMAEEVSFDMSDDERPPASGGKKTTAMAASSSSSSPVHDAESEDENSLDHSEKETITIHDHSYESVSDVKRRSPEAISDAELDDASSRHAAVLDAKVRSPDVHSSEPIFDNYEEHEVSNDQSQAAVSDEKRSTPHSEREFAGTDDRSHELISDVWKDIVGANDQSLASAHDEERSPDQSVAIISDDHKAIVSATNDSSNGEVSDHKSTPETAEQEFSGNDDPYELVADARIISERAEEDDIPNERPGNATRHVTFSVAEKGKVLDVVEEDQEDKWKDLTEEEEDELESLWEHQDLIEQLKLELKKVRSIGLPTILEESETPKAPMEDLKPWRIDAKFLREDPMDELNKFFKSYRERMRKFDILCYQKMYAIGMHIFTITSLPLFISDSSTNI